MKDVMTRILLLLVSVMMGLLLCEGLVRLLAPQRLNFSQILFDPDDDLIFKLRKNLRGVYAQSEFTVIEATNSLGLRDHEIGTKPPGSFRVLGLGDSFSFGNGVTLEDTYFTGVDLFLRKVLQ